MSQASTTLAVLRNLCAIARRWPGFARTAHALVAAAWYCSLLLVSPAGSADSNQVLVIYSNNRLLPANVEFDHGLQDTLPGATERSAEFLDAPRFMGEAYDRTVTAFLREKYAPRPPSVIVAAGAEALLFLLKHHDELFPQAPVVHAGVTEFFLRSLEPLPADVQGTPIRIDFTGTIDLALRLRPNTRRLVLVTGVSAVDRQLEAQLQTDATAVQDRAELEVLAGLSTATVQKRLGALGDEAAVITPGWFKDGEGHEGTPREAVERMAGAARGPIFAPFATLMGTGIVGGSMVDFRAAGRQTGQTVGRLLAGTPLGALELPRTMPSTLEVDWRQVERWHIDPDRIPTEAAVRFRPPGLLSQHRDEAIALAVLFLLQSALIAGLLTERRRRRLLELAAQHQRTELAHASRLAVAGELAGAIAHEINQPLGAILSNADAADLILESVGESVGESIGASSGKCIGASNTNRSDELRAILADIRRDDLRASEVIRRLRTLIAKQAPEWQPFDLDETLADLALLMGPEARRRHLMLVVGPTPAPVRLLGDRVQFQQVLVNLVLNAMDAVADLPEDRRTIQVSVARAAEGVVIRVSDQGPGIAPEHLPRLFDSFFTTKHRGMGLGLSIARTIVEAHRGRIWAESALGGGALFQVALPVLPSADQHSTVAP